jgi:hypothetical protein
MTRHAKVSYIKSTVRIFGYISLTEVITNPWAAAVAGLLIVAEVLGIIEELGE